MNSSHYERGPFCYCNLGVCGMCQLMLLVPESVCCHEIVQIWQKIEEQMEVQMSCITEHPGFKSTCLDVWVLKTAYYAYRQQHSMFTSSEIFTLYIKQL